MKTIFISIFLFSLTLFSCVDDEISDLNNEVTNLQDSLSLIISQHEAMLDSISELIANNQSNNYDIKALKMSQIGSLFESMGRQPEIADQLILTTEMLYTDYTELLPISDKAVYERGQARGSSFGILFEAIARQPEAFEILDFAATKFLGEYSADYVSDELLEITRTYAFSLMNESLARNPQTDSLINLASTKYLNHSIIP
ncbi:MAG: hypothetical protein JXR50_09720 [Prolixibacteraceae bacterium]|nr:hypothetical protein [Prolixibacteraceae bacterium]MBN2650004.1 hypothetical protein [Prolixibacteraceae bacterium]